MHTPSWLPGMRMAKYRFPRSIPTERLVIKYRIPSFPDEMSSTLLYVGWLGRSGAICILENERGSPTRL
jgi:hypothetical protein